jgi:hypothetical protein
MEREEEVMETLMGLGDFRGDWEMEGQGLDLLGLQAAGVGERVGVLAVRHPPPMLNLIRPLFGVVSKLHGGSWRGTGLLNGT